MSTKAFFRYYQEASTLLNHLMPCNYCNLWINFYHFIKFPFWAEASLECGRSCQFMPRRLLQNYPEEDRVGKILCFLQQSRICLGDIKLSEVGSSFKPVFIIIAQKALKAYHGEIQTSGGSSRHALKVGVVSKSQTVSMNTKNPKIRLKESFIVSLFVFSMLSPNIAFMWVVVKSSVCPYDGHYLTGSLLPMIASFL